MPCMTVDDEIATLRKVNPRITRRDVQRYRKLFDMLWNNHREATNAEIESYFRCRDAWLEVHKRAAMKNN